MSTKIKGWSFRVLAETDDYGVDGVRLIEAYYNKKGRVVAWAPASGPMGNDFKDLAGELENMTAALRQPVLTTNDLPKEES